MREAGLDDLSEVVPQGVARALHDALHGAPGSAGGGDA
jgi:hypothetical protein